MRLAVIHQGGTLIARTIKRRHKSRTPRGAASDGTQEYLPAIEAASEDVRFPSWQFGEAMHIDGCGDICNILLGAAFKRRLIDGRLGIIDDGSIKNDERAKHRINRSFIICWQRHYRISMSCFVYIDFYIASTRRDVKAFQDVR